MAYSPIVYPPQFHVAGEPASGYWLKAYRSGTSTAIQLATDRTGNTLVNKIQLNSEGYPEVSNVIVIPHIDQENKLALYPTETAADTDDTNSVIWIPDKIDVGSLPASYVDSVDTLSDLRNYSGESRTVLLEGGSASGDGDAAFYAYSSGQSVGTYTDNGDTVIVPTGGDGSAAYLLLKKSHPDDLEYPVSTTTSGGTAGLNYDVSDWPDTLVSGRTYYAISHTTSSASYSITPGSGGAISVLRPDGSATKDSDWPEGFLLGFRYDGTDLIQTSIPYLEETGSFTGTFSGFSSTVQETVYYNRSGAFVELWVEANVTGTSNSSGMGMTGMPASLQPDSEKDQLMCLSMDDGSEQISYCIVATNGTVGFSPLTLGAGGVISSTQYTSSGTKGIDSGWSIRYSLG